MEINLEEAIKVQRMLLRELPDKERFEFETVRDLAKVALVSPIPKIRETAIREIYSIIDAEDKIVVQNNKIFRYMDFEEWGFPNEFYDKPGFFIYLDNVPKEDKQYMKVYPIQRHN